MMTKFFNKVTRPRVRYFGLSVIFLSALAMLIASVWAQDQRPAPRDRASLSQLREAIVTKNIFHPARTPAPVSYPSYDETPEPVAAELLPPRLNRSFSVVGFTTTGDGSFANLHFDNPSENRMIRQGDKIEFVTVLEVSPPYIRCDWEGITVRIDVGESSDNAYARLLGLGNDYELLGTTVTQRGRSARFYFSTEGRELTVEEGDLLGNARVIEISHGRVVLQESDGNEIIIR